MKLRCPECLAELEIRDDALPGELIECPECGATLEVRRDEKGTVELVMAELEAEDWGE